MNKVEQAEKKYRRQHLNNSTENFIRTKKITKELKYTEEKINKNNNDNNENITK